MNDDPRPQVRPALLVLRRTGSVLISVLAVVVAVVVAVLVGILVFVLGLNLGLVPAIILGALALFAVAWLLTGIAHVMWRSPRMGARLPLRRRKSPFIVAGALLAVVGVVAGTTILAPVPDEPIVEAGRPDPSYWDLNTGSRVAYWHFPAEGADSGATPVIFVHGGPGGYASGGSIDYFQRVAKTGHDVYIYDQAGAGLSSELPEEEYTVERSVADLQAIQDEIGAPKVDLIGHSAGGYLVEAYTAAHADRVEHVALISPGGPDPSARNAADEDAEWAALEKIPGYTEAVDDNSYTFDAVPLRALAAILIGKTVGPAAAQNLLSQEDGKRAMAAALAPLNIYANLALADDFAATWEKTIDALESEQTPTLLIRAEYDYVSWTDQQQYTTANSDLEIVYVEDATHGPWDEQPNSVYNALDAFFNDEPQPGGVYDGTLNPLLEDATGVKD
ncbi:alpha/beta fold hydrolase [Microbacterium sp. EST19A]|uniref:alpha/beta fold hydrolase n=1 Tax=Microbacterium sp. EST19A TaxID=2862681 RepID=UPI001CBDAADC|nr:alpha/beta fold hydrolase [Microbacterium sp. EST19A]